MEVLVQHHPSYALAIAYLEPNELIQVEVGAMVGLCTQSLPRESTSEATIRSSGRVWTPPPSARCPSRI